MPLVRVDTLEEYTTEQKTALGDGVHQALVEAIGIPPLDRFQVIASHSRATSSSTRVLGIRRTTGSSSCRSR